MQYVCDKKEIQQVDKTTITDYGISQAALMERAALATVEEIVKRIREKSRVLIIAGRGNNGGDGLAIARLLYQAGHTVEVYIIGAGKENEGFTTQYATLMKLIGERLKVIGISDTAAFLDSITGRYETIVDALFGVGLARELDVSYQTILDGVNEKEGLKVAVDIPSGLDSSTGKILGSAFKADITVTMGLTKAGLLLGDGPIVTGEVVVKDIGFLDEAIQSVVPKGFTYDESDLDKLPERIPNSNKGTYGKVAVIAGSRAYGGAAYLAAAGVLKAGAGLVKVFSHSVNRDLVLTKLPEALFEAYDKLKEGDVTANVVSMARTINKGYDAVVFGPGVGKTDFAREMLRALVEEIEKPLIIDADGLNMLAENTDLIKRKKGTIILTPHFGEMSRLTGFDIGEIAYDQVKKAMKLSEQMGVICALKSKTTTVTDSTRKVYYNTSGNNGMSTAGSGDVLTGIIAAFIAGGLEPYEATCMGVYVHGLAGDKAAKEQGVRAMTASDILANVLRD
ncbi:MAG: NAD(P)H-hydrate dehydratase [Lachnospiraceae bacterium]|nr:NAD(P)H-hydrate dehydratase [Lachnospiraceae bacterium]